MTLIKKLTLLVLLLISGYGYGSEMQYLCEFNVEIKVRNYATTKPLPRVEKSKDKFLFIYDGKNGSFINLSLSNPLKSPLYVINEDNRITFIEKNTSANLFLVTIFIDKKQSNERYGAIKSFLSYGVKPEFYDPGQSFGSCLIIKN